MRRIELAVMLYIALRGLQPQSNGVLGDNTILQQVGLGWLKDWVQDIVAKLRRYASGGLASGGPGGAHASGTEAMSS